MTFKQAFYPDTIFNSSHKMGEAKISLEKALAKFPDYETEEKCEYIWSGCFSASDGNEIRASFWSWKGGLTYCGLVSIWIKDDRYLDEFKRFIQA